MLVLFKLVHKSQMSTHSSRLASEEIRPFNTSFRVEVRFELEETRRGDIKRTHIKISFYYYNQHVGDKIKCQPLLGFYQS